MTTRYVFSGATGLNDGTSWANAYTTLGAAVDVSGVNGDIIKIHKTHQEEVAGDTSYYFTANINIVCVDKDAGDALATMGVGGWIGHSTLNRSINLLDYNVYIYGVTFRVSGTTSDSIQIALNAGSYHILDKCYLWMGNSSASSRINLAAPAAIAEFIDCTFRFGTTTQMLTGRGQVKIYGGSISADGAAPAKLFGYAVSIIEGSIYEIFRFDLSAFNGFVVSTQSAFRQFYFYDCKFSSTLTLYETQVTNYAPEVFVFNCSSGDEHYHFAHYSVLGQTVAVTSPYANDGALYDGTNHVTWKIITSAICSEYTPYISPWIDRYHSGSSAITPSLEILRDDSTTALQDNEVWGEFSYQGTTGFPLSVFVNDRMALLGAPANQAAGVGLAGWTGESGTAWSGKLVSPSITPAEIGFLRARVSVGKPSATLYVDPTIRI